VGSRTRANRPSKHKEIAWLHANFMNKEIINDLSILQYTLCSGFALVDTVAGILNGNDIGFKTCREPSCELCSISDILCIAMEVENKVFGGLEVGMVETRDEDLISFDLFLGFLHVSGFCINVFKCVKTLDYRFH